MKLWLYFTMVCFLAVGCSDGTYGDKISSENPLPVNEAYHTFLNSGKTDFTVKGSVSKVCQTEGCWFNYKLDSGDLFVDFGHKFNIPKNSAGKSCIAKGYFYRDTTSIEQLKEYAKDEGKSEDEISAITKPEIRISFFAKGVKFLD